jgi:hypothetical protein
MKFITLNYIIEGLCNFKWSSIVGIAAFDGKKGDQLICYFEEVDHGKNQHGDV